MCKIAAFSNLTQFKKTDIKRITIKLASLMQVVDNDAFGFSYLNADKSTHMHIYTEKQCGKYIPSLYGKNAPSHGLSHVDKSIDGVIGSKISVGIWHSRTSTNSNGIFNAHPFNNDQYSLVHNGVVTDHGEKYPKLTDNDSEDVLHRFTMGIDHVEDNLSGYYAFLAIDKVTGELIIVRDDVAKLHLFWVPLFNTYFFVTADSIGKKLFKHFNIKYEYHGMVSDNCYVRMMGNEITHKSSISPLGYSVQESKYAAKSLGVDLHLVDGVDSKSDTYSDRLYGDNYDIDAVRWAREDADFYAEVDRRSRW